MVRLFFCRFKKRRYIKALLIVIVTMALLKCFFLENIPLSITKPLPKIMTSMDENKKGSALALLGKLKGSKIISRSDDKTNELSHVVGSELTNGTPKRNEAPDKLDVSRDLRYQATKVGAQNVNENTDYRLRKSQLDDRKGLAGNLNESANTVEKISTNSRCPKNALGFESLVSYGKCKPHRSSEEGCAQAKRFFTLKPAKCEEPHTGDICNINVLEKKKKKILEARCNLKLCRQENSSFLVKTMNPDNGKHDIIHTFPSIKKLEKELPLIMEHSRRNGYNYVFLECKGKTAGRKVVQLLPMDPRFTVKDNASIRRNHRLLNVNIILIDSVARAHFYRSLPKTIDVFKRWNNDSTHSPARVFDFELFQAVEGHTADNTHAMFTGKLFPDSIDRSHPPAVGMEDLFGRYKRAGYQTSWQEDLCWKGRWGLFVDLGLSFDWKNLAPKLKEVFIDTTGKSVKLYVSP